MLEDNNCYEAESFIQEKIDLLLNSPIFNYKDPEKRKDFFNNNIIKPIIRKLKKNCNIIKIDFNNKINKFLNSYENEDEIWDDSDKNIEYTWIKLINILKNLKTKLNNQKIYNCFEIYEQLKEIQTKVRNKIEEKSPLDDTLKNDCIQTLISITKDLEYENDKNCFSNLALVFFL